MNDTPDRLDPHRAPAAPAPGRVLAAVLSLALGVFGSPGADAGGLLADGECRVTSADLVVVPVGGRTPAPPAGAPATDELRAIQRRAGALSAQTRSVAGSLDQAGWKAAVDRQLVALRSAHAALQQDVAKLQAANRNAGMNVGVQVSSALQARLNELGRGLDGLPQVRDASTARGALTQVSVSLDGIVKTVSDSPLCCAERTCCYVGIR